MHEAYLPANVITTTNVTFQIISIVKKNPISKAIIDKNKINNIKELSRGASKQAEALCSPQ